MKLKKGLQEKPGLNPQFNGFTPDTFSFLKKLYRNNNHAWFRKHKDEYLEQVLRPMQALAADLSTVVNAIDPQLEVRPQKVISRIYRDIRFSKDKTPYKTNLWLTYKRPADNWMDSPAFFFEVGKDFYRYGMGFYSASSSTMVKFRYDLDNNLSAFLRMVAPILKNKKVCMEGEMYKRKIKNDYAEGVQTWYQRKNIYFTINGVPDKPVCSKELVSIITAGFHLLLPLYSYFWKLKNSPDPAE